MDIHFLLFIANGKLFSEKFSVEDILITDYCESTRLWKNACNLNIWSLILNNTFRRLGINSLPFILKYFESYQNLQITIENVNIININSITNKISSILYVYVKK